MSIQFPPLFGVIIYCLIVCMSNFRTVAFIVSIVHLLAIISVYLLMLGNFDLFILTAFYDFVSLILLTEYLFSFNGQLQF